MACQHHPARPALLRYYNEADRLWQDTRLPLLHYRGLRIWMTYAIQAVDTNVLLRRILNDDEQQSAKARKVFESGINRGQIPS